MTVPSQQWPDAIPERTLNASAAERLSLPHAEALVLRVAESLADRMNVIEPGSGVAVDDAAHDRHGLDWRAAMKKMSQNDRVELARHALNAALEALDSAPTLAAELLPSTAAAIQAQIARGCTAACGLESLGYLVAEIDRGVWEQLLHADRRTVPMETMEPDEAADRRREISNELGIDETDLRRYRRDLRVEMVARESAVSRTN